MRRIVCSQAPALHLGRHLSSSPSHWVIYNALELRDEVERAHLSSFLARLRHRAADSAASGGASATVKGGFSSAVNDSIQLEFSASKECTVMAPSSLLGGKRVTAAWAFDLLRFFQAGGLLPAPELEALLALAADALEAEPTLAALTDPGPSGRWAVVGDLHGSLSDLGACLAALGRIGPANRVVFNGDFVDRGAHSVEVLAVVCALKLALPACVHLNRGNHEDEGLSYAYDLAAEVGTRTISLGEGGA